MLIHHAEKRAVTGAPFPGKKQQVQEMLGREKKPYLANLYKGSALNKQFSNENRWGELK